jgi:hypothetical protein
MGSYLFKKRLKIAIIRDNQKLQMKGQTNLWSKKKDKQLTSVTSGAGTANLTGTPEFNIHTRF